MNNINIESMDTKNKIIYSTIEIIAHHGIHNATAGNISKSGNFNKSIIFYHFENINDLLLKSLIKSIDELSPILKNNYCEYDSIDEYLNVSIINLINHPDKVIYLKVIMSFAHQTMYLKDFLKDLRTVVFDDLYNVLIEAIKYYKIKEISNHEVDTLASLIMATFNGLGVVLLIDGSNDKFIENWKQLSSLINNYIK
ncbi:MAG TPA: TetR/AcrR family transcriptional regulator [Tissierellaceae bacterium]